MDSTCSSIGTIMTTLLCLNVIILTIAASHTFWLLHITRQLRQCNLSANTEVRATSNLSPTTPGTGEDMCSSLGKTTTSDKMKNSIWGELSQVTLISPWIPPWLSKSSSSECTTGTSPASDLETSSPTNSPTGTTPEQS